MQVGAGSIPGRSRSGFMKRTALYYVGSVAKWASVYTCSLAAGHFGVTAHTILPWRQGAIIKPVFRFDSCHEVGPLYSSHVRAVLNSLPSAGALAKHPP